MKPTLKSLVLASLVAAGLSGVTGCDQNDYARNGSEASRTAGEELDDKTLAANVKSALAADTVKYPEVKVSAYKGTVQLSGFVDTKEQKSHAGEVAGKVVNVKKVENNISVKP
jgi:osmotically-inducible protein OsmY